MIIKSGDFRPSGRCSRRNELPASSVLAAVLPDGREFVTRETMEGYIGGKIAGENGFGYDPIFCVEKYGCTTAELSEEQKNEISHRGKALRAMKEKLAKENL